MVHGVQKDRDRESQTEKERKIDKRGRQRHIYRETGRQIKSEGGSIGKKTTEMLEERKREKYPFM